MSSFPPDRLLTGRVRLVFIGIAIGLITAELGLRFVGYSFPSFYQADRSCGYSLRPYAEGWYTKEGKAYIRINSNGLRDFEHSLQKPPNTIRIALLGDSYAEALQVPVEQAFWSVMAEKLNQNSSLEGRRVEVINFGVSGYGTAQELITLQERVWQYHPDVVLLAITTNNDISDNSRLLKGSGAVPYFVRQNGQLVLDDSFRRSRTFGLRVSNLARLGLWLYDHLRVVQAVSEGFRAARLVKDSWTRKEQKNEQQVDQSHLLQDSQDLGIDNFVYWPPSDQTWNDAWLTTEELLRGFSQEVQLHDARFIAVTLSNAAQVLPDPSARKRFMEQFGIADLFYPDRRIAELGNRENFRVITLAPFLQAYAQDHHVSLHGFDQTSGFGHWNTTGHQVAGEMLAKALAEEPGLLK